MNKNKKIGRPEGMSESKKNAIINSSLKLIRKYGLKKISIDEICTDSQVSRMTFYKHFKDKIELAIYFLHNSHLKNLEKVNEIIISKDSFYKKFELIKGLNIDLKDQMGEIFINDIINDQYDERIKNFYFQVGVEIDEKFEILLKMGIKEGVVNPKIPISFFLIMIKQIRKAFFDNELERLIEDPIHRSNMLNDFFLFGVSVKPNKQEILL